MSDRRIRWRKTWETVAEFRVPSATPGIAFQVGLTLQGVRPRRMPEHQAIAFARSSALDAVAAAVARYSVLTAEAAAITATAACLAVRPARRGLRIEQAVVALDCDTKSTLEARQLEVMRRTAQVAGTAAILEAARAEVLRHVVLEDHDSTVAYLFAILREKDDIGGISNLAAQLRRDIDDHRPDGRWIRVAEALTTLVKDKSAAEIKDMIGLLAEWAGHYSPELSEGLKAAAGEQPPGDG